MAWYNKTRETEMLDGKKENFEVIIMQNEKTDKKKCSMIQNDTGKKMQNKKQYNIQLHYITKTVGNGRSRKPTTNSDDEESASSALGLNAFVILGLICVKKNVFFLLFH